MPLLCLPTFIKWNVHVGKYVKKNYIWKKCKVSIGMVIGYVNVLILKIFLGFDCLQVSF